MATTAELRTVFRASFFGVYFANTSDTLVDLAIVEIVGLSDSAKVLSKCPKLYEKYVVLKAMLLLHSSGITEAGGNIVVPDLNADTGLVVQTDKVADTSRTFFKPEKLADGKTGVLSEMRSQIKDIESTCLGKDSKTAKMYGFSGGSNYRKTHVSKDKKSCGGC